MKVSPALIRELSLDSAWSANPANHRGRNGSCHAAIELIVEPIARAVVYVEMVGDIVAAETERCTAIAS